MIPRHVPRVLWRSNLLLGGERDLVMFGALLCGSVAMSASNLVGYVVCGLLWGGWLAACRWFAKVDPQYSKVSVRRLFYRQHYPAQSRPCSVKSARGVF